ncbi:MAG: DUF2778 domain-containing protein [Mesorhizobium sp.]|nr:MAG: DUF2778 domain-containing protein [Mesorhizobium sp.]
MRPGRRWAAIPVVGVAIALWSVATMACLHSVGTSLTAASNSLPQSLLSPRSIALADHRRKLANPWTNSWAPSLASRQHQASLLSRCDAGCAHAAANFVHEGKVARLKPLAQPDTVPLVAEISPQARFDSVVARAALSPQKLAAAFAHTTAPPPMLPSLHTRIVESVRLPNQHGPASVRFGPEDAEIERSSRLALALAIALPEGMIDVLPEEATADPAAPPEGEVQMASLPPKVDTPRAPALSPRSSSPAAMPSMQANQGSPGMQSNPGRQSSPGKPAKRSKAQAAEMLAYAKPDSPAGGGGVFRSLFTKPGLGSGVAVYDISAKTVYMPDGSRLEAHSGRGSMADQPRYANRKNFGPTPPHTYDLRLRESRFHGVEALRLIPVDGKNKYGRDGFLAHTYLLRGGRAESSGCVAFKDYARFLAAFKKGKIKRLVVRG